MENARHAGRALAEHGLTLLVEPLNDRDNPGYFFVGSAMALRLVSEVGLPNVKFQYDIYHMQRGEGELAATIERNLGKNRAHPDRRQPRSSPARHRRDQLPLPLRAPRQDRLRRLRLAGVPAARHDRGVVGVDCGVWAEARDVEVEVRVPAKTPTSYSASRDFLTRLRTPQCA